MDPVDPISLIFLIWSATQHYADFQSQVASITGHDDFTDEDMQRVTDFLIQVVLKGCGVVSAPRG